GGGRLVRFEHGGFVRDGLGGVRGVVVDALPGRGRHVVELEVVGELAVPVGPAVGFGDGLLRAGRLTLTGGGQHGCPFCLGSGVLAVATRLVGWCHERPVPYISPLLRRPGRWRLAVLASGLALQDRRLIACAVAVYFAIGV